MTRVLPTLLLLCFCWSCCSAEERTRNLRLSRTRNFYFTAAPPKPDEFTSFPSSTPSVSPVAETAPPRPDFTDFPSGAPTKGPQDETEPPLVVFPLGEIGEEQVLAEKAAVCAEDLSQAQTLCEESPVCKYVLDPDGNMTDDLVPGQADGCVRRCDTPQGSTACGPHDHCLHFVVTCSV